MIKSWILRGIKNGILTTKYPKVPPTPDEIPRKAVPPTPGSESDWMQGRELCPTKAIEDRSANNIDLGKCIYCRRCAEAGFEFDDISDKMDAALQARAAAILREGVVKDFKAKTAIFKKSYHILMMDVGSCNACNLEVLNLLNPYYDMTRLGIFFTNSPKHADTLVVVGALNKALVDVLKRTYESIPHPKLVISIGACAISGGIFQNTGSFVSPIGEVIPVDVEVPGCPPTPIQILEGLLLAMSKLEKRDGKINTSSGGFINGQ
jgi:formate hydrogenlyase subunit 7